MEEGEVVVGFDVASGGDPASCFQPGVGAFDRPAVAGLRVTGFDASLFAAPDFDRRCAGGDRFACPPWFADPRFDLALAECFVDCLGGVAAVGPQLGRPDAAGEELIDERQQVALLVFVAGGKADHKRCAVDANGKVETAARAAAERARDLLAPFFASTSEASTITRDQLSRFASRSWSCSSTSACSNSPFRDHSSSRRRHVSPLGSPSSR